jgi:putative toxin-antitoxin system antitoxin component (TIGR02293 family)
MAEPIQAEVKDSILDSVVARAIRVIGDRQEAMHWLGTPVRALGYATPISLLGDEDGIKEILAMLDRLEQGVW